MALRWLDNISEFMALPWDEIRPYGEELLARPLTAENVGAWLADWTRLANLVDEAYNRLYVATTVNTADEQAEQRFNTYVETVMPAVRELDQRLKEKLLASGLEPAGFAIPLRNLRAEAQIFREENLPLLTEIEKLNTEYNKLVGARTVDWDGEELTLPQLSPKMQDPDRSVRERAFRLHAQRGAQDRPQFDRLWSQLLDLRQQVAHNAGFENYRDYRWLEFRRFDYTPEDCKTFHAAIETAVVPAVHRLNERRKARMGLDTLHLWDVFWFSYVDPEGRPGLKPFETVDELNNGIESIFQRVDPVLGGYYHLMRQENLLDLESRKHKAGGGYMTEFAVTQRPFIFTNAVGIHNDVQTLLHEGGHSFHSFESAHLPYFQQRQVPMEFAEVASMAMELLGSPYLARTRGGFYRDADANRALAEQLEQSLRFWPYMAVVDAFQHWVYEHPAEAHDPDACDAEWARQFARFMPDLDWSGAEEVRSDRWRTQGHITTTPFYYVEYGLAQLGAVLIWRNALRDQAQAVADYRRALSLGYTVPLPELYAAAGAKFAFDADTLGTAVDLMMEQLDALESA